MFHQRVQHSPSLPCHVAMGNLQFLSVPLIAFALHLLDVPPSASKFHLSVPTFSHEISKWWQPDGCCSFGASGFLLQVPRTTHIYFSLAWQLLATATPREQVVYVCLRAGCEASACLRRHPRGSNRNDPSAAPAFGQDFYVNQLFRSHIALYLPKIDHSASKPQKKLHTLGPLERPATPAEQLLWCQPW